MHLALSTYHIKERWLSARGADIALKQTPSGSKLRKFVQKYLNAHGPPCAKALKDEVEFYKNTAYERDCMR